MCRNIKTLFNFQPPATDMEIREAATQYVRKLSGYSKPSKVNQDAFYLAIDGIYRETKLLVDSLITSSKPKNRQNELMKAKTRARNEAFSRRKKP